MHQKSPKIQEDMAFPKWLSVKQKLQKSCLEIVLYNSVAAFETNISRAQ
jgi:hypothetical protein